MKLKFIGVGSAFTTTDYYQSNMLLTAPSGKKMLIDCGSDVRFALAECNINLENIDREIDAIYISHLHSDHFGGLEWLAFNTFFNPDYGKPKLYMEEKLMDELWQGCLRGSMAFVQDMTVQLHDYFACYPLAENGTFQWEGINFTLFQMLHVNNRDHNVYSYGLLIDNCNNNGTTIFIATDTQFNPGLLARISEKADLIFHDCETSPKKSGVHGHYNDLLTLLPEIKQKMWLHHYQPHPDQEAEKDGFKGFVQKGQEFDFTCP